VALLDTRIGEARRLASTVLAALLSMEKGMLLSPTPITTACEKFMRPLRRL
jgi:hypothetical protein